MLPQLKNHTIAVDPTTGGMTIHAVDVVVPVKGGSLVFERFHDSLRNLDLRHGGSFFFDERLYEDPDGSVRHLLPSGTETRFVDNGDGTYTPSTSLDLLELVKNLDGTWTVTYPSQTKSFFRPDGKLIESRDSSGNSLRFTWNTGVGDDAFLTSIVEPAGRTITSSQAGNLWTFQDWTGRTWSYEMDGLVSAFIDPEGRTVRYEHNQNSSNIFSGLSKISLPDGTAWVTVEALGPSPLSTKVGKLTFANGLVVTYSFDWANRETTITEGDRVTVVEYDADGYVTRRTDPLGNVWEYQYDSSKNLTQITDPRLGIQSFTHDSHGNRLTATDQLDNTRSFEYHPTFNRVTQITEPDPFNYTTIFDYDPDSGLLTSVTDRLGKVTAYEYFANGLLKKVTDPNSNTVQYAYNEFGQLTSITDGRGKVTTMGYDPLGRLVTVTDPLGRVSRRKYNAASDLTEVTDPLGNTTRFFFDENGQQDEVHDALGRVTQTRFDAMGQVVRVKNALGNSVAFVYNEHGSLTELVNMNGQSWVFAYDALERMTKSTDPLGRDTTWTHDPYCGSTTRVDANGWRTTTIQDLLCRLTRVEYQDESFVAFTYDELSRRTKMTQPGKRYGEMVFGASRYGTDPADDIEYTFNEMDRMTSVVYPSPFGDKTISMGYDDGGRMTSLTDINGVATTYTYFGNNVVNTATRASKTVTYALDDTSQVTSVTLPNGVVGTMTYDSAGQVTRMEYKNAAGEYLLVLTYEMDKVGNRTLKRVARGTGDTYGSKKFGEAGYGTNKPVAHEYVYDAINQLVAGSQDGQFIFDPQGNRTAKITYGGTEHSTFDAADELLSQGDVAFEWSPRGDLAAKRDGSARTSYRFNYGGHLEQVTLPDGAAVRYSYLEPSPLLRDRTTPGEQPTHFFWSHTGSIVNEVDSSGNTALTNFLIGNYAIGTLAGANGRWFLTDLLGSVLAVTDDSGVVVSTVEVDAWGDRLSTSGGFNTAFLAAHGLVEETLSDLYYVRHRWYSSRTTRFISRDLAFEGNRFAYATNNPASRVDLNGLFTVEIGGSANATFIVGGTLGGSVGFDPFSGDIGIFWAYGTAFGTPSAGCNGQVMLTSAESLELLGESRQIHVGGSGGVLMVGGLEVIQGIPSPENAHKTYFGVGPTIGLEAAPGEGHIQFVNSNLAVKFNGYSLFDTLLRTLPSMCCYR